ncbi:MAG: glutathione S-transferase, partial [Alcanivorax sp.]|nr:glutathione S-transferase [Alcanivorax sp.]
MSDLILHHYALSPFSEKVRAMLGYAGLDWQSVTVREMPPRPMLAPLAGGYRKILVAQSGADV